MQQTVEEKTELFETMPIRRAAMTLVIPTVISQLVTLVYNMADTWYIGRTGDPYQVAAVTVTYPVFMLMNALANLFGIGGSTYFLVCSEAENRRKREPLQRFHCGRQVA